MDDKRFDELIKAKAESHVDMSTPSGGEMSRLFDQLPSNVSASWFASTANRLLTVAGTSLFILTIFLVYRTIRLEETIKLMDESIQRASISGGQIIYQYDTSMMDSLVSLSVRLDRKLDSLNSSSIQSSTIPQFQPSMTLDSKSLANQVMTQLMKEIESNPVLIEEIMKRLAIQDSENLEEEETENVSDEMPFTKESIASKLVESGEADDVLTELIKDTEKAKAIANIISGNEPDDTDALTMGISKEGIERLSNEKKKKLLEEYIAYDSESVITSAKQVGVDSSRVNLLDQYIAFNPIDSKRVNVVDSFAVVRNVVALEEARKEQVKANNRSFMIGLGGGAGRLSLDDFGNTSTNSFKLVGEYQLNNRFGLATGLEYYSTEVETYDVSSIDLTRFDDLNEDDVDIDEFKVNLQWLDIPLEAKFYFKKGKISPYAIVSIRARALIGEEYKIEGDEEFTPSFEKRTNFIVPSYGYGLGSQFYINPKFNGALQLHHSVGGNEVGLYEQKLNTLQLQGILYFDLK